MGRDCRDVPWRRPGRRPWLPGGVDYVVDFIDAECNVFRDKQDVGMDRKLQSPRAQLAAARNDGEGEGVMRWVCNGWL